MRTRVKVCGITRVADGLAAARAGVDTIGLVFYESSPRYVTNSAAAEIVRALPAFVGVVGLFVNPTEAQVRETLTAVPLDLLQFHGDESPEFCSQFGKRWIKAIRVREKQDVELAFDRYRNACGLLADAYDPALYGGTGQSFNWALLPAARPVPLILAGGLTSDNVARAIAQVKPWAVDVSGGVESHKGIKDVSKITDFMNEVHRVDQTD